MIISFASGPGIMKEGNGHNTVNFGLALRGYIASHIKVISFKGPETTSLHFTKESGGSVVLTI